MNASSSDVSANGSFTFVITSANTNAFKMQTRAGGSGTSLSVTNISVIEITDDTNLPRINYSGFTYQDSLPSLILCGKQAIDNDMNATGQMLSALLGWSQATYASELDIEGENAIVTREVDGGLQKIKIKMPSVISVDLRLNEPRYASLPNIMKAKKKPMDEKSPEDLGVDITPRLTVVSTSEPAERAAGVKVSSVAELISKLKDEAGVI